MEHNNEENPQPDGHYHRHHRDPVVTPEDVQGTSPSKCESSGNSVAGSRRGSVGVAFQDDRSSDSRGDLDSSNDDGRDENAQQLQSAISGSGGVSAGNATQAFAGPSFSPSGVTGPVATVGLVNEGCTCYLNSLLQLLFHISYFRSSVYRIPVEDNNVSVYKALQELFFEMQERTTPARTKKLTDAFGWGEAELFVQHDIQEMATLLRDNLEEKMKATVTEGAINQLFEGVGEQFVETLDKSYSSRRRDVFYDIHLPISNHRTLMDSLTSLTAKDQLTGDNKYRVERDGERPVYMDAEKGYAFKRFPLVTWFHLKRFDMDLSSPTLDMKKVNSRLEFPTVLDLTHLEQGISPEEERRELEEAGAGAVSGKRGSAVMTFDGNTPAIYDLHGVIVHRGTVRSGHYYCYIRDWDAEKQCFARWIEFEDENVHVVDENTAVKANYGGSSPSVHLSSGGGGIGYDGNAPRNDSGPVSGANAYVLCYVRRAAAPVLLSPCPTDIISQRVKDAMRRELAEEEERVRRAVEARQRLTVYIITDRALSLYCRSHQTDLFARDSRTVARFADCVMDLKKQDTVQSLYERLDAQPPLVRYGVALGCRLWRWGSPVLASALSSSAAAQALAASDAQGGGAGYEAAVKQQQQHTHGPGLALPTYTECLRESGTKGPATLEHFLTRSELTKPLSICLYLQLPISALPRSPIAACTDYIPFVKRFSCDTNGQCVSVVTLRAPTVVKGLCIQLSNPGYRREFYVRVVVVMTTSTGDDAESPMVRVKSTIKDGYLHVPLDSTHLTHSVRFQCLSSAATSEPLAVTSVHVQAEERALPASFIGSPPPVVNRAGSTATTVVESAAGSFGGRALAATGTDRILVFFKFFDHTTCSVRYAGCALIDSVATVRSCEPLVMHFVGVPYAAAAAKASALASAMTSTGLSSSITNRVGGSGASETGTVGAAISNGLLRFFEESKSSITRELNPEDDLWESYLSSGCVLVAQFRMIPLVYRGAHVEAYYRALAAAVDMRVIAVVTDTQDNRTATVKCLEEHKAKAMIVRQGESKETGRLSGIIAAAASESADKGHAAATASAGGSIAGLYNPALDPYTTTLPCCNKVVLRVMPESCLVCRMSLQWRYETVCECVAMHVSESAAEETGPAAGTNTASGALSTGRSAAVAATGLGCDPNRIRLYRCLSATELVPEERPLRAVETNSAAAGGGATDVTLEDMLFVDDCVPTTTLFYEQLQVPRGLAEVEVALIVTLRDAVGHALHTERYVIPPRQEFTMSGLARWVLHSVTDTKTPHVDPWGTVKDVAQCEHFVLAAIDRASPCIRYMREVFVPSGTSASSSQHGDARVDYALTSYDIEITAVATPLRDGEQRISCCHGDYHANGITYFSHPFFITVADETSVQEALQLMLSATHVPMEALHNESNRGVMMITDVALHFPDWSEAVSRFWAHTPNNSGYIPCLMLNHSAPKAKPGSQYVAQSNPQLKISKS